MLRRIPGTYFGSNRLTVVAAIGWHRLRHRALRIGIAEILRAIGAVTAAAMTPAPTVSETIRAVALLVAVLPIALIGVRSGSRLRLAAGDEGRQGVRIRNGNIAGLNRGLRVGLLRARLLLIARREPVSYTHLTLPTKA